MRRAFIFEYVEPTVSVQYFLLSLIITLLISLILGVIFGSIRSSVRGGLITLIVTQTIFVFVFFSLRNTVKSERIKIIHEYFANPINDCDNSCYYIDRWIVGLNCIRKCPDEVGYYIQTCDILEKDRDYEAAATLIELGLDFMPAPPPQPLCQRLQKYYESLKNRPRLDSECNKFYD